VQHLLLAGLMAFGPATALDQLRPVRDLAASLSADDAVVRARAACELKEHGDGAADAVDGLVRLLGDATLVEPTVCKERWADSRERQTTPGHLAAAALVAIGSRTVPELIGVLRQPLWVARRNAAWALGALDDPRGVAPVTAALQDREAPVRAQAAWALGAMDADSAVQALVGVLKDPDEGVRKQAAWALGAIGSRTAVSGLSQALKDSQPQVRHQAAWALGAIGDRSAVPALVDTLKDADKGVREQAAWALGAIGDSRATQGLVAALKDSEAGVRRQAAWALGAIGR
jgi:HEAT repeat protein